MKCEYGCGQDATHVLKSGKNICESHWGKCPVNKKKNSDSMKEAYDSGVRNQKDVYKNLDDATKNRMAWSRDKCLTEDKLFVQNSTHSNISIKKHGLARGLLNQKCYQCNITEWLGSPITLELDHINGLNRDNRLENLRLLCPNCHSQTDTFRGKNINAGHAKVSESDLISAIVESKNIRRVLMKVGLTPKGANYERVRAVMLKHNLSFKCG